MAFQPLTAGQRLTASTLNNLLLIGAVVFRAYCSSGQNIPSGAESVANAIVWDTVDLDRFGAGAVSSSLWTCPMTGWWTLEGGTGFNSAAGGTVRSAAWYVNGALQQAGRTTVGEPSGTFPTTAISLTMRPVPYLLTAGDTVQLVPSNDSGASAPGLALSTGSLRSVINIRYGGPS